MDCRTFREEVPDLLDGEPAADRRAALEEHRTVCRACAELLEDERSLRDLLAATSSTGPSEEFLDRCRRDLSAALARESGASVISPAARSRGLGGAWGLILGGRPALSPALAAILVVGTFLAGYAAGAGRSAGPGRVRPAADVVTPGDPALLASSLDSLETDPSLGRVRLAYRGAGREVVEGPVADPGVRRILVEAVRRNANPGLRLDAMETLRPFTDEAEVRAALLTAMREDDNPGARLRAIDVLSDRTSRDREVRHVVLEALLRDRNPGVRVGAVDLLAVSPAPETLPVFERLARHDDNSYVRLRSAAVVEASLRDAVR